MPECTSFWITEFGFDFNQSSTRTIVSENYGAGEVYRYAFRDFDSRFVWTLGPMFNTSANGAVGGTLSISPLGGNARVAVEARRRWWTSAGPALDLSGGVLRMGVPNAAGANYPAAYGVTAGAFVVGGDLINVNGRVDLLVTGGKVRAGTSVGLGGGSYIAVIGTVALGLLVIAIISAGPFD